MVNHKLLFLFLIISFISGALPNLKAQEIANERILNEVHLTKKEIIKLGLELKAPLQLTWSCYSNDEEACGVCDSCALRLRGFQSLNIVDPIPYKEIPNYKEN